MNRRTFIKTVAGVVTSAVGIGLGLSKKWTHQYLNPTDFDKQGVKFRVSHNVVDTRALGGDITVYQNTDGWFESQSGTKFEHLSDAFAYGRTL